VIAWRQALEGREGSTLRRKRSGGSSLFASLRTQHRAAKPRQRRGWCL